MSNPYDLEAMHRGGNITGPSGRLFKPMRNAADKAAAGIRQRIKELEQENADLGVKWDVGYEAWLVKTNALMAENAALREGLREAIAVAAKLDAHFTYPEQQDDFRNALRDERTRLRALLTQEKP